MVAFSIVGCAKKNVIPDDTLAKIFHDAFVVNAYVDEMRMDVDSLHLYEPIFNKYGYTAKDVIYTVGNFSRRKSSRLGTVVEQAISRLEKESKAYAKKVVILDTIRNVAVRSYTRVIYKDSLISARKRADSTRLHIEISPVLQGEYSISYSYKSNDDMDKYPRNSEYYFIDENGHRNSFTSHSLRNNGIINRTLISRTNNRKLVVDLGKYNLPMVGKKKNKRARPPKKQDLDIRAFKVVYKPNEEAAIDSLFERYVNVKIFADGFLIKTDSLALSADSTRVSTAPAHND
jgi:hypothetical protein